MKNGKFAKRGVATKVMVMILSLVLVAGLSIGGTLAWLTAQTGTVTNTFTVGDINITLAETTEDLFKIVPGGTAEKDPTLTVQKTSEKCYVYVSVTNNVVLNGAAVATPNMDAEKWELIGTSGNEKVYRYKDIVNKDIVDAAAADVVIPVFTQVSYAATITKADIKFLNDKTIEIQGYAHQSDNTTVAAADAAAAEFFGVTAV